MLSLILNTPPKAQVGSVSNGIRSPLLNGFVRESASSRVDSHNRSPLRLVLCVVPWVLPLKVGRSGILNLRCVMNCNNLSAPKALVKMSVV